MRDVNERGAMTSRMWVRGWQNVPVISQPTNFGSTNERKNRTYIKTGLARRVADVKEPGISMDFQLETVAHARVGEDRFAYELGQKQWHK